MSLVRLCFPSPQFARALFPLSPLPRLLERRQRPSLTEERGCDSCFVIIDVLSELGSIEPAIVNSSWTTARNSRSSPVNGFLGAMEIVEG